jgi:hypothetical protein
VLAAKSADALTQFELDGLNWYLKEHPCSKSFFNQVHTCSNSILNLIAPIEVRAGRGH